MLTIMAGLLTGKRQLMKLVASYYAVSLPTRLRAVAYCFVLAYSGGTVERLKKRGLSSLLSHALHGTFDRNSFIEKEFVERTIETNSN